MQQSFLTLTTGNLHLPFPNAGETGEIWLNCVLHKVKEEDWRFRRELWKLLHWRSKSKIHKSKEIMLLLGSTRFVSLCPCVQVKKKNPSFDPTLTISSFVLCLLLQGLKSSESLNFMLITLMCVLTTVFVPFGLQIFSHLTVFWGGFSASDQRTIIQFWWGLILLC